jgi:hypothetical protein
LHFSEGMVIPFVFMLLFEDMAGIARGPVAKRLGFFRGMAAMIVSLIMLSDQPETWPHLVFTSLVTAFGIASLIAKQKPATPAS